MSAQDNLNPQQFYHGTRAGHTFAPGDLVTPGRKTNFPGASSPHHVYMTESLEAADTFSGLSGGHVYRVQPTGPIERDPEDLAYEKQNGATFEAGERHYRSRSPLRVLREVNDKDWEPQ